MSKVGDKVTHSPVPFVTFEGEVVDGPAEVGGIPLLTMRIDSVVLHGGYTIIEYIPKHNPIFLMIEDEKLNTVISV